MVFFAVSPIVSLLRADHCSVLRIRVERPELVARLLAHLDELSELFLRIVRPQPHIVGQDDDFVALLGRNGSHLAHDFVGRLPQAPGAPVDVPFHVPADHL